RQLRTPGCQHRFHHPILRRCLTQADPAGMAHTTLIDLLLRRSQSADVFLAGASLLRSLHRLNVSGSGAMTAFAAIACFAPLAGEFVSLVSEILGKSCRVTVATHVIPILKWTHPEQRIGRCNVFFRIKVKPALSAFFSRARVPCERQGLKPA